MGKLCSYVPNTEALHHLEKPQTVAPPPDEHEEDEEMEEAKAEPPKLWLTQHWNVESQHTFFFEGEGFVYISLVMLRIFRKLYVYDVQ